MSPIPTESRIFANRYARELKRKEKLHATRISPGAVTWDDAINRLFDRMAAAGSPTKQAAVLAKAITYLDGVSPADTAHIGIVSHSAKRAAALGFVTLSAGTHPFLSVEDTRVMHGYDGPGMSDMTGSSGQDRRTGSIDHEMRRQRADKLAKPNEALGPEAEFSS